jgi:hypothetical protein
MPVRPERHGLRRLTLLDLVLVRRRFAPFEHSVVSGMVASACLLGEVLVDELDGDGALPDG